MGVITVLMRSNNNAHAKLHLATEKLADYERMKRELALKKDELQKSQDELQEVRSSDKVLDSVTGMDSRLSARLAALQADVKHHKARADKLEKASKSKTTSDGEEKEESNPTTRMVCVSSCIGVGALMAGGGAG